MFRYCLIGAVCALFAGCAADGDTLSGSKAAYNPTPLYEEESRELLVSSSDSDVVCRKKRRTGSHFLFMVCKSKAQEDLETEQTQDALRERQLDSRRGMMRMQRVQEVSLPSLDGG